MKLLGLLVTLRTDTDRQTGAGSDLEVNMMRRGFDRAICTDVWWGGGGKNIIKMYSNETIEDNVFVVNGWLWIRMWLMGRYELGCVEGINMWENIQVKIDTDGKIKLDEERYY